LRSTMQEVPLSIARIVEHGRTVHGSSEVATWTGEDVRRASYAEVGNRAARLAHGLRELGITGDQRVATFMWNDQEHLEAYLAVPAMGAVLHTLNIRLFPEQVIYIANHAEDEVVIVDSSVIGLLAGVLGELKTIRHVIVVGDGDTGPLEPHGKEIHSYEDVLSAGEDTFDWPTVDENSAAAMCYTSGTTGNPKGVAYSHRSIYLHSMQVCMAEAMALRQADKVLAVVPQFHAMAWGIPYAALLTGSSLLMPERFLQPEPLLKMIEQEKPTFAGAVPTIWQGLLDLLDKEGGDVSSLREVVVGGSACPPALMKAFQQRHGVRILHAWGMTEMSPLGTVARVPAGVEGDDEWAYRETQGRFAGSVEARLVGGDGEVVPNDGESVGELEVRGPWITSSYHLDDDPEKFHDGWLRTGDVGTITHDGYLTLTDRAKDVIKSGGEWISSVELENALMAHPAVAEAAVVGVPDDKWGERPLAAVVLRADSDVSPDELREFLADKVAKWQVPERFSFIDEVPKTSVGKFDKKVLRKQYAESELEVLTAG
jgi:acyl-CoA synthetase (AMP-forming)/AMP-acid ligase II